MCRIKSITPENSDTFTLALAKEQTFLPGQFNMLYLFGYGEVAISISGDPSQKGELLHTIRAVGSVTNAMQKLKIGDEIGVRGPFGSSWPLTKKGCDVLLIAGGLGLAPMRPLLFYLTANQNDYKKISLLYGARSPKELMYQKEFEMWKERGINVQVTVDHADLEWKGQVGVVTKLIGKHLTSPENTLALLCGPEIMLKFALHELMRTKIDEEAIFISMERNMQCAVGFCGHCQYGPYFICKDGPVFSYKQLKKWLTIKEL
jgi:NAD(P)H-flavin reductase